MTTPFDPNAYFSTNSLMSNPGGSAGGTGGVYLTSKGARDASRNDPDYKPTGPVPYEEARLRPTTWDANATRDFISKGILYKIPGFSADMGMPEVVSAWDDLVKSAMAFSKNGSEWTPWDVMDSYKKEKNFGTVREGDWLYDAASGRKLKYVGPRTKKTTDKRVNLSSPEDVKALTTQMLTELLGRAPNAEELAKYRASINGYENQNPEITTTTSTLDDQGEVVSQSSKTSGGASEAGISAIVSDAAKKGPEYGKYQSATTYYDAMMQMIGGG